MGDRISIQFQNGKDKSIVVFHHWGGKQFVSDAQTYIRSLLKRQKGIKGKGCIYPLDRREPQTVVVDFLSKLTGGQTIESTIYLGTDENDGDNSDNGHWIIDVNTGKARRIESKVSRALKKATAEIMKEVG